jgi:hypothetical protein
MSNYQTGRNLSVQYAAETTFGTAPSNNNATAYSFRPNSGSFNLDKSPIQSNENRSDGMMSRGRHGYRKVQGGYTGDLSLGTYDPLFEAVMRGTWSTVLTITQATMTSITVPTIHTIVAAAGSWITQGLRVGDVIRLTSFATTADNNLNLRITALSALTITVAETLTVDAAPDASFTITRPKKLVQGTTARSFTVEESELDIVGSELFTGVRFGSLKYVMQPNGMITVEFSGVGKDMTTVDGSMSPYFGAPTTTTSLGMTAVEASILLNGTSRVDITAMDLTIDLKADGVNVVGSTTTPEVFTNLATVTLNVTALRSDLTDVAKFLNETSLALHVLATENESEPKDFFSLYVPYFTFATSQKSALGSDGGRTATFTGLVGIDPTGATSGYDATMVKFETSAT